MSYPPLGDSYLSSSGCTHLYRVISRFSASLIMCTGGALRPFRHDRHFSEASSFHSGVSRGRRMASSGRLALVLQRLHSTSSQPRPPLRHCPIVGEGCAGPPKPSIRNDARSASRAAFARPTEAQRWDGRLARERQQGGG